MNLFLKQISLACIQKLKKFRWKHLHWYMLTAQAITLQIWLLIPYWHLDSNISSFENPIISCRPWELHETHLPNPIPECEPHLPAPPVFIQLRNMSPANQSTPHETTPEPPKIDFHSFNNWIDDEFTSYFECCLCEADYYRHPEIILKAEPSIPKVATSSIIVEEEPRPINLEKIKKQIQFPRIEKHPSGKVVIRMLIGENGKYIMHKVMHSPHLTFSQAVEQHIAKLRFTPAIQQNKPIHFWVNIPFSWDFEEEEKKYR